MAKTWRNIWPHVVSWDNLVLAYHKCRRRKRGKPDVARFDFNWEANLLDLQRRLNDGTWTPGPYRHFVIHDPKTRTISAAPFADRVVHHALVNVLEPLYEREFIFDSYACRKGKGTHRALDRAQVYLRRYPYYLKTDVVKFFPSIDHQRLMEQLRRRIADARVLAVLAAIIATGAGIHEPADRPRGLPIGNLTSQFLANVFLSPIDHAIKEEWQIPGYVRYCDDLVLFGRTKEQLRRARADLEGRMAELGLRLHADKTQLRPARVGLKFLGFVLRRDGRRLQQVGLKRWNRRWRTMCWLRRRGRFDGRHWRWSWQAWRAHIGRANTDGIVRALCRRVSRRPTRIHRFHGTNDGYTSG